MTRRDLTVETVRAWREQCAQKRDMPSADAIALCDALLECRAAMLHVIEELQRALDWQEARRA